MVSQLELKDFQLNFSGIPIVRGVNVNVKKGEIIGLVGESGCGKSVTCMAAMGLLDENASLGGSVIWEGQEIDPTDDNAMCKLRGREMAMIFQDPMSSLNPVQTIGKQIYEAIKVTSKKSLSNKEVKERAVSLLQDVGVPDPAKRLKAYPHQLSGGLSQRVMIAMMLAGEPSLLIADEPTTALDVTVQAQIMELLISLRDKRGMSIILVTHDLGVVAEVCDRLVVMYCGRVIETGPIEAIFKHPRHPYTNGLIASLPKIEQETTALSPIPGVVPQPHEFGTGCDFAPRCPNASDKCPVQCPELEEDEPAHLFSCFHPFDHDAKKMN